MKKFFAILLSAMLMLSLAVPASAASITIDGGASGSEYAAYKLLNATNSGTLFAYTLNEKYTSILQTATGETEQAGIIAYIQELDAAGIRTFADAVYAAITTANLSADYTSVDDSVENDAANIFESVDQGYYLIAETKVGNSADTKSLVMLNTAGDEALTVTTKEDKPTVEKKVEEKNDSTSDAPTWGDSADYDVDDVINYKITGTVSSKYADYASYYYSFRDTMDKGLTYNQDAKVYVVNDETKTEVTNQFTIANTTTTYEGDKAETVNGFTATANLKNLTGVTIDKDTTIVVEYTATLNKNAVSGSTGNKNEVVLKYENDPYTETNHTPTTPGETPKDTNIVFTYDVIVDKVDKDGNDLAGAGFTLYKWDADAEGDDKWVVVGSEVKGDTLTTFEFEKLDEGKYKLVEATVPEGYNKADDIIFTIESTLTGESLTELVVKDVTGAEVKDFTVTVSSGKIETDIVNQSGTELPETGGMGTTIFYIVGGIMVVAAVILLVTKKRMSAEG